MEELRKAKLDYDCLLVGSDQTWNPLISREQCLAYFLDFGGDQVRRVSFASSFGVNMWPESHKELLPAIDKLLHRFSGISVREVTGQNILKQQFSLDSSLVLDPTMLHSSYAEITSSITPNHRIVCYLLNRNDCQLDMARYLSYKKIGRAHV